MALAVTGVAQAGVFDAANSTFALSLGGINNHPISAQSNAYGKVILVDNGVGGHDLVIAASVWSTVNFSFGTSLYTGIPIIDDFELSVVNNPVAASSSFTALNYLSNSQMVIGPGLGGTGNLSGSLYLIALGAARSTSRSTASVVRPVGSSRERPSASPSRTRTCPGSPGRFPSRGSRPTSSH